MCGFVWCREDRVIIIISPLLLLLLANTVARNYVIYYFTAISIQRGRSESIEDYDVKLGRAVGRISVVPIPAAKK